MNLLIVTRQFGMYTGGTVSTVELLKRLNPYFDTIKVLTLRTDDTIVKGVDISIASNIAILIKMLHAQVFQHDYIGYSDDHLGFLFSIFSIPYVHTYHGNWPDARKLSLKFYFLSFLFIPMYTLTVKKANQVVSVSKYMRDNFVLKHRKTCNVIYNGIKHVGKNTQEKSPKRFIMVGNIDKRKYQDALTVFEGLATSFNYKIDIYGKIIDKKLAKNLNKFDFVNIMGQKSMINFKGYTALLCMSKSENLPVSIVESLVSGVPVISFDVGGIKEVIKENINGNLIDSGDTQKFVNSLLYFNNDYCVNYLNEFYTRFNWDVAVKEYVKVFNQVEVKQHAKR